MAVYPESRTLYATLSGSQVDITPYAIKTNIEAEWGIDGIEATDLLASTGTMKFTLNNRDGRFNPSDSNALAGWKKGVVIELIVRFGGADYKRFKGRVDTLTFNDNDYTVDVSVVDWMDYSAKFPLQTPETQVAKRGDEVLTTIISQMGIQPRSTYFDVGDSTFGVIFDSTDSRTKAYSEFAKIANSEVGHIYLQKDNLTGEKLVFENRSHRTGLTPLDEFPMYIGDAPRVLTSSGFALNTTGGFIRLRQNEEAFFDNNMDDITMVYGQGVVNSMEATSNPKTYDTSGCVVLHRLAEPLFIGAGKTLTFYGNYTDAYGNQCNVITGSMIQPVATTDYLCNTNKAGTGTNLTATLSGCAVFGSAQAKFTYTNSATKSGYITRMNARGIGIYDYSRASAIEENEASILEMGYQSSRIDQSYQADLVVGTQLIKQIVDAEKQPRTKVVDVSFIANENNFLMLSFLNVDIGSLVHIKDDRYDVDGYFYVQKVKFSITLGGIVRYTLILRSVLTLALGLTLIGCGFSGSPSGDAICYGNVEALIDLPDMSISTEIYPTRLAVANDIVAGWVDEQGGFELATSSTAGKLVFTQLYFTGGGASGGVWRTTDVVLSENAWQSISVTRTTGSTTTPTMYVDGVAVALDTVTPPTGAIGSVNGMDFCIGNIHGQSVSTQFTYPFNGKIRRVDVHNKLLSATEALAWSNGETIEDGLVFQGNTVRTKDLDLYTSLSSETTFLDNVYGAVGTINGSPTASTYIQVSASTSGYSILEFDASPLHNTFTTKTYSAWIYPYSSYTALNAYFYTSSSPSGISDVRMGVGVSGSSRYIRFHRLATTGSASVNMEFTADKLFDPDTWTHVVVTQDLSQTSASSVSKFYINGVLSTGAVFGSSASPIYYQNAGATNTLLSDSVPFVGMVTDVQVYNSILSASTIALLAKNCSITEVPVFNAPFVKDDYHPYKNQTLGSGDLIYDRISGSSTEASSSGVITIL